MAGQKTEGEGSGHEPGGPPHGRWRGKVIGGKAPLQSLGPISQGPEDKESEEISESDRPAAKVVLEV